MLLHEDNTKFKVKPTGAEIGAIKARFTKSASIKDVTVEQLAAALTAGKTVQPGVTMFSEKSRAAGKKGTVKEDFTRQLVFMDDIDNKRTDVPLETPAHVAEVLAEHNLQAAFMYDTFNSTPENERFRFALVSDEEFTVKAERDRVQTAIIKLFPQSDPDCTNADRIFFGTDKGLIDGYTNYEAVCRKSDLLALADALQIPDDPEQAAKTATAVPKADRAKFGSTIPTGQRHGTLVSFASTVLTKYGVCDKAYNAYMERVAQCEEPKPDDEIQKIWRDACNHYEKNIAANPDYVAPAEYATREFALPLIPSDYTDVGQARLFFLHYGSKVRFSPATKWLVYNGKKWEESELKAHALSQELTDKQLVEAKKWLKKARAEYDKAFEAGDEEKAAEAHEDEKSAKAFKGFVISRRKTSRILATLTEAEPAAEINTLDLDADPFLLNTPAGTVDLKTGKIRPHSPTDYITKMTAVSPSRDGMELWLSFLDRMTCGDRDLQEYHQCVAGMQAVGKVFVENLIIATGNGGNGKSTFYNAQARCMGDYASSISSDVLIANSHKNKSPEYAELRGKRLVIAAELEDGMRLDTGVVKRLCSVDPIRAEKKFKAPFDFIPSHTTVLYTNHLPKVGTNDKGTWDRLKVVPFNATFRGQKGEVMNYGDYLFEHAGGAILLWIIEGARKFIAANFQIEQPACVNEAIAEYRTQNDWFHNFIYDRCESDSGYKVGAQELYSNYRSYCDEVGDFKRSSAEFKGEMMKNGYKWHKTKTGAFYYGIRVQPEFLPYSANEPPYYACG